LQESHATRVTRSSDIRATPDDVWALIADLGGLARWASGIDHSSIMSEHVTGIGTTRRIQAGRTVLVEQVDAWEPGLGFGYSIEGLPPFVVSAHNTWMLRSAEAGASVTIITDVVTGRGLRRVAGRIAAMRLGRATGAILASIGRHFDDQREHVQP
jgi:hypothetical protein